MTAPNTTAPSDRVSAPTVDVAAIRARAEDSAYALRHIAVTMYGDVASLGPCQAMTVDEAADVLSADVPALCARVAALEAERDRIYGIAKMRERHRDRLAAALSFIADAGCQRRGSETCAPAVHPDDSAYDPESDVPCVQCIARRALDASDPIIDAARDAGRARGEG